MTTMLGCGGGGGGGGINNRCLCFLKRTMMMMMIHIPHERTNSTTLVNPMIHFNHKNPIPHFHFHFHFLLPPTTYASHSSSYSSYSCRSLFAGTKNSGVTDMETNQGATKLRCSGIMDGNVDESEEHQEQHNTVGVEDSRIWSSHEGGHKIDMGKYIFCNRSLNMKGIVAVGFDMDYTLAQYKPETFETMAYDATIKKLVYDLDYPPELLEWSFDWKYMVRGLVVDKKRGNILKMDRHKYVKVAYHGFSEMSKEEKIATYGSNLIRDSFDEPDYALIDTLFSLAEAYLFAQLVDLKDRSPEKVPSSTDYCRLYKDVRAAVDMCHRDGTLKQVVAKDPSKYIYQDPLIVPMLKMIRASGRATFLVTNSLWDYTDVVMTFLCQEKASVHQTAADADWLRHFDVVIAGRSKI